MTRFIEVGGQFLKLQNSAPENVIEVMEQPMTEVVERKANRSELFDIVASNGGEAQ